MRRVTPAPPAPPEATPEVRPGEPPTVRVTVSELLGEELSDLRFRVLSGEDKLDNRIDNPRVQKPGLAFAGYYAYIKPGACSHRERARRRTADGLGRASARSASSASPPAGAGVHPHQGIEPLPDLSTFLRQRHVPLLASPALSSVIIKRVSWFLEDHLVPTSPCTGAARHLRSRRAADRQERVGKSESALDLVTRGHSLVADDRVTVKRYPSGDIVGYSETPLRHHMELRGLGIVNIKDLFGLAAVRERKTVDLVIELEPWDPHQQYDRLG